jgi:putative transposase
MNEEIFDTLDDASRKLTLWRYDYNNVRPNSPLGNKTPAEACRALDQTDDHNYGVQSCKLSL